MKAWGWVVAIVAAAVISDGAVEQAFPAANDTRPGVRPVDIDDSPERVTRLLAAGLWDFRSAPRSPLLSDYVRMLYLVEPGKQRRKRLLSLGSSPFRAEDYDVIPPWLKRDFLDEVHLYRVATPLLAKLAADPDPAVRRSVLQRVPLEWRYDPKLECPKRSNESVPEPRWRLVAELTRNSISTPDQTTRECAAKAAAIVGSEPVLEALLSQFAREKQAAVLVTLATALGSAPFRVESRALDALVSRLETSNDETLVAALARALCPMRLQYCEWGSPRLSLGFVRHDARELPPEIVSRLSNPQLLTRLSACRDAAARAEIAHLCGTLGSPEAKRVLTQLVFDGDGKVRLAACRFFHSFREHLSLGKVVELSRDPAEAIRFDATVELAKRGDLEAVAALIERVGDPALFCLGTKAPSFPRIANAARFGLYRLTGQRFPAPARRERPDPAPRRLAHEWWKQHQGGRRMDWLVEAFARECEQNLAAFDSGYGVHRLQREGDPHHVLVTEIVRAMDAGHARAWLSDQSPAKQLLALLYASRHSPELAPPAQLLEVAKGLLRTQFDQPVPDQPRWRPTCPELKGPVWKLLSDVDAKLMHAAALALLLSLDLREDDLKRVRSRIEPFLLPQADDAFLQLAEKTGPAWEKLFVMLAARSWQKAEPKPDPSSLPTRRRAVALLLGPRPDQEWDPSVLAMMQSEDPRERQAIFSALAHRLYRLRYAKTFRSEAVRIARAGLADPSPTVRGVCAAIVAQTAGLEELFGYAQGNVTELVRRAIGQLRTRFRNEVASGEHARRLARVVATLCRSEDPELRAFGFRHAWHIKEEHASLYDSRVFVAGLGDPDPAIRQSSCRVILRLGSLEDKLKLLQLADDDDGPTRQVFFHTVAKGGPPQLVERLLARLAKRDAEERLGLSRIWPQLADESVARVALEKLLGEGRESRGSDLQERNRLLSLVTRFPGVASDVEVLELAIATNGTYRFPKAWQQILESMAAPKFAPIAVRGMLAPRMKDKVRALLRGYFSRGGPEAWQALAQSWCARPYPWTYERQKLLQHLIKNDGNRRFRDWLAAAVRDATSSSVLCMALQYNHALSSRADPIEIPSLLARARALIDSRDPLSKKIPAFALAYLDEKQAMELWKAIAKTYSSDWYTCRLEASLRRNPGLRVPILRERIAAGDHATARHVLAMLSREQTAHVRELLHSFLDNARHPLRATARQKLICADDLEAAEKLARRLLAGAEVTRHELRLLAGSRSRTIKQWMDDTGFVEKAVLTKVGMRVFGSEFVRAKGVAGVRQILDGATFDDAAGELASIVRWQKLPFAELLALPHPAFVGACLDHLAAMQSPTSRLRERLRSEGEAVLPILGKLAESGNARTRCLALRVLSYLPKQNGTLRRYATARDPWIAMNAIVGLTRHRDRDDLPVLRSALGHRCAHVRAIAAWELGRLSDRDDDRAKLTQLAAEAHEDRAVRAAGLFWGAPSPALIAEFVAHGDPVLADIGIRKAAQAPPSPRLRAALYRVATRSGDTTEEGTQSRRAAMALAAPGGPAAVILVANALKRQIEQFGERRKALGGKQLYRLSGRYDAIKRWLPLLDTMPESMRSAVLVGLLEDPSLAGLAAARLEKTGDRGYLKLVVRAFRQALEQKRLPFSTRSTLQGTIERWGPLKLAALGDAKMIGTLRDFESTLPSPPDGIARGWQSIRPPQPFLPDGAP